MSEILAYGFKRRPADLAGLCASRLYIDADGIRADRESLLRDLRPGDVVRVLHNSDLGGPQWKRWRAEIEALGATVEEHKPANKPARRPGRPQKVDASIGDLIRARDAWCAEGASLQARLIAVGAILGQEQTLKDRHRFYARFGSPGSPKKINGEEGE